MKPDLPSAIVGALERVRTSSPAAMREAAYEALRASGVDVDRLVRDELETMRSTYEAAVERREHTRQHLRLRVQTGQLPPAKLEATAKRLASLDLRIKTDKQQATRILKRIEARALPTPPEAPTPERLQHYAEAPTIADRDEADAPLVSPRYRLPSVIDRLEGMLTPGEYMAAVRTRDTYEANRARSRVADLSGGGAGVPGPRMPVSVRQVQAGAEWRSIGHRLPVAVRGIILNFICGEAPRGRDEPMTLVEFGRAYGGIHEEKTARGVAYGAIKTACALLELAWQQHDQWRVDERHEATARAKRGA